MTEISLSDEDIERIAKKVIEKRIDTWLAQQYANYESNAILKGIEPIIAEWMNENKDVVRQSIFTATIDRMKDARSYAGLIDKVLLDKAEYELRKAFGMKDKEATE